MKNYLIFFGKSSAFTSYAFDENGLVSDFDKNVFKDFDLLESRFLVNDQIDNKIALSKYNFNYNGNKFSMLKIYGCAMAMNADRISGSSYGVAFISESEILLSKGNIYLLNSVRSKFKELVIENNRFVETTFLHFVEQIWSVFQNANYFQKIVAKGAPFVSSNSTPQPFFIENFDDLEKIGTTQIKISSKLYFTSDLEHLKRSIKYLGSQIPILTISNGKTIEYKDAEKTIEDESLIHNALKQNDSMHELQLNNLIREKSDLEYKLNQTNKYRLAFWINLLIFLGIFIYYFFHFSNLISNLEARIKVLQTRPKTQVEIKMIPFVDKDNNISKDKFVLKKGDKIPEFIKSPDGIIRKMTTEEKNKFKQN